MKNSYLEDRTSREIDDRVARVHRDLGYSGGEVRLPDVFQLLRLDLGYYAADDPTLLQEVAHKLKIGAKQVIERPTLLLDVVRKFDLQALFLPDRKRILLDSTLPDLKKRWNSGHEVSHAIIPWHADYMLGDTRLTLSLACHEQIEAEANYCTGRLLFPSTTFMEMLGSAPLDLSLVRAIAKHFGNTITSTLWRCVENSPVPTLALIGGHPRRPVADRATVEYLVRSRSFETRFSSFTEEEAALALRRYCGSQKGGPLGQAEVELRDEQGTIHVFIFETFCLSHLTVTLGNYLRPSDSKLVVTMAQSNARNPLISS